MDHFDSRLKGGIYGSRACVSADTYVEKCIFVDSMSSLLYMEYQLGSSSPETIRDKQNFEKMALDFGVLTNSYKADNGVFKANVFFSRIREHSQKLSYCGVNVHHKNGAAERAIITVSECARDLMLYEA